MYTAIEKIKELIPMLKVTGWGEVDETIVEVHFENYHKSVESWLKANMGRLLKGSRSLHLAYAFEMKQYDFSIFRDSIYISSVCGNLVVTHVYFTSSTVNGIKKVHKNSFDYTFIGGLATLKDYLKGI